MQSARVSLLRVVGIKQVMRALKAGRLARVYLAEDAAPSLLSELEEEAKRRAVPVEWLSTMCELARRFHVEVPSAAAGEVRN